MHFAKPLSIAVAALVPTAAAPLEAQTAQKAAPAVTQPTPAPTSLNCLLASNVFAQRETDPKLKAVAQETLYFYLGRLDPRTTPEQLKAGLKRTLVSLKGVNAAALMSACAHEFQAKGQMLQSVGQEVQQGK